MVAPDGEILTAPTGMTWSWSYAANEIVLPAPRGSDRRCGGGCGAGLLRSVSAGPPHLLEGTPRVTSGSVVPLARARRPVPRWASPSTTVHPPTRIGRSMCWTGSGCGPRSSSSEPRCAPTPTPWWRSPPVGTRWPATDSNTVTTSPRVPGPSGSTWLQPSRSTVTSSAGRPVSTDRPTASSAPRPWLRPGANRWRWCCGADGARNSWSPSSGPVLRRLEPGLVPGAILLLHDNDVSCRAGTGDLTRRVLGPLGASLRAKGLTSVTLDQLLPPPDQVVPG